MSVKSQFLKKLQARQPAPVSFTSKTQADIAAFRQRMAQLQEQMDAWLTVLAAFPRSNLRRYEMKNPRNCVDFKGVFSLHEMDCDLMRQQKQIRR